MSCVEGVSRLMNIATWKPPIKALSLARSATCGTRRNQLRIHGLSHHHTGRIHKGDLFG